MKIYLTIFCLVLYLSSAKNSQISIEEKSFYDWLNIQNKMYDTWEEFYARLQIFIQNYMNTAVNNPSQMNQFADLKESEFLSMYTGLKGERSFNERKVVYLEPTNEVSIDWRDQGAVSPVKNQGQCGSCWAFSTTGSLEGANFISSNYLQYLSEQQLVDCSGSFGNQGCNGGLMDNGFRYAEQYRVQLQADYPYTAKDGTCSYNLEKGGVKAKSYNDVQTNSEAQLKAALMKGPVSVGVQANYDWQMYSGGVTDPCGSGAAQLNHGVLAVGFSDEYWIVKNSWGSSWGEAGYIRLKMGNTCGILNDPSYPIV